MKKIGNNFSRLVTFISRSSISSAHIALSVGLFALVAVPTFALASTHHRYRSTVRPQAVVSSTISSPSVLSPAVSTPAIPVVTTTIPAPVANVVAPPAVVASTSQRCMNYGHQQAVNGQYNAAQVDTNLATLKASGITCLRLAYKAFGDASSQGLALRAQAQGFSVILGGDWDALDVSQLSAYDAAALAHAKWAQQNNIPQISLGNEQEGRVTGLTSFDWAKHIVALAAQVRQVYSGKISYEANSDYLPIWQQSGIGALDMLGLNLYCGVVCNTARISSAIQSFGVAHVYASEINADMGTGLYSSDQAHADEIKQDYNVLLKTFPSTPLYYFNFISGGTAPANWGLYSGTTLFAPLSAAALGIRG